VETVREIIEAMRAAAPAGQPCLDDRTKRRLSELTALLIAAKAESAEEHARFLGIRKRSLCLPEDDLTARIEGSTVLVTGGTGCIGSVLMAQLAARRPGRLVSVSRGCTEAGAAVPGAQYLHADIRDADAMDAVMAEVKPDVVFHVAAQRDPGLAEIQVHRTVSTNVLGARNVLAAAAAAGVRQVVSASTGKALRPYSPDMYTASKRAAEWINSSMAASGDLLCSAARFTHVLDNSIIYQRLLDWADGADGGAIRLHSPEIAFYVQSALESAQLLLIAFLGAEPGEFRIHAITDLGWPLSLLDVALGVLRESGSPTPIYLSGYDAGYEEVPFPGLYDPMTAGDVSPLLNAFETAAATDSPCGMVDAFRLEIAQEPRPAKLLAALDDVCQRTEESSLARSALDELSWSLLDATLRVAPRKALSRAVTQVQPHREGLRPEHRRVLEAILDHADSPAN
jgi:nucleoside-diphosphate-sugar epimerase